MSAFNRNTDAIHGHCACGALQYSIDIRNIENDLKLAAYCHCARCQRLNGAPYIWTNHWLYHAVTWKPLADGPPPGAPESSSSSAEGLFSPAMQTFEALKGRKWKLRCRQCGSPMGSWNAGRGRWTIWPTTLARRTSPTPSAPTGVLAEGDLDVPDHVLAQIRPRHHQFYGPWRCVALKDGLEKWEGYEGQSQKVTDDGEPIG